jgi:hypothetical protein
MANRHRQGEPLGRVKPLKAKKKVKESRSRKFAFGSHKQEGFVMGFILVIILVLLLLGVVPRWPHSRRWGYGPSGGIGLLLVIVLILWMLGVF